MMHVERLTILRDTINNGWHTFDDLSVAFSMGTFFTQKTEFIPDRPDVPKGVCNATACFVGFTILLFADQGVKELMLRPPADNDNEYNESNVEVEAWNLLGLDFDVAHELFFGSLSSGTTGAQAAKVINHFLMTEKVDWSILEYEAAL